MSGTWRVALAALPLAAFAPIAARAQHPDTLNGAQVYATTCGRCHNPRSPAERGDREWAVITTHMRVRANLSGREARAVLGFLQALNAPELPAAAGPDLAGPPTGQESAPADRGAALVARLGCAACHRVGEETAGTLGPDLNTVLQRRQPDYVLAKLADPSMDNPGTIMPGFGLSAEQRSDILEYLRTLR